MLHELAESVAAAVRTAELGVIVEFTSDQLSAQLRSPEIIPNELDRNIATWLIRIGVWGQLKFYYQKPSTKLGAFFSGRSKISKQQFLNHINDDTLTKMFGRWGMVKDDVNKMHFKRKFVDADGKTKVERLYVEVKLKPELRKALAGK